MSSIHCLVKHMSERKVENDVKKLVEDKRLEGIEQLDRYSLDKENLKKYLRDVELLESLD